MCKRKLMGLKRVYAPDLILNKRYHVENTFKVSWNHVSFHPYRVERKLTEISKRRNYSFYSFIFSVSLLRKLNVAGILIKASIVKPFFLESQSVTLINTEILFPFQVSHRNNFQIYGPSNAKKPDIISLLANCYVVTLIG